MRIAAHAGLGVLGFVAGVAGSLVQGGWFPFGVLLALAGCAGLFWGGALLTRSRIGAASPAGGWVLSVLVLTVTRPQGDFVYAAGAGSYVYLLGGMTVAVVCATLAPGERPLFAVPQGGTGR
ncbi:hypothetical protein SAMN06297387_102452 [Streptomyces zhaozhouensis]|uniref:Integral membrane protein n=1 Tax=Streptomyces zhaozhouensis TaxID=1300267 RepID=A0A286DQV9_9ACTN|nr:DUF6113 family protein [Streptomyces zhaozhouensis]SOD61036.1 hypothetical protein SAMN06297387_102452 [Streptomyces zhaozhouensis]